MSGLSAKIADFIESRLITCKQSAVKHGQIHKPIYLTYYL
jgi:hypothetical protein